MSIRVKRIIVSIAVALCPAGLLQAQAEGTESDGSAFLEHYNTAQRFQREGDLEKAAAQYRAFLADALGKLAIGRAHVGDYALAASSFDDALALVPDSPSLRLEYARTALTLGDFPHAETLAKAFLRDYPRDRQGLAQAHQILGRTLLKMNRDQDAKKELELAVALDPSFVNGYDLAVACLDLDDEKCAVQVFGEIQASFGDTPEIHMSFGRAYGDSDFAPRAVGEFRTVIAENPKFPGAHYCLAAALLATGGDEAKVSEAEQELKKELVNSPSDFLTYAALGKIAATHQRYSEAEQYLKKATSLDPKNPDAFLYLGQMYLDTNRPVDAKAALRQAIQLTTDVSRNRYQIQKAHFLLGRILVQEHREDEAHAEMQIARTFANKTLTQDQRKLAGTLFNGARAIASEEPTTDSAPIFSTTLHDSDPNATRGLNDFEKQLAPVIADSYDDLGAIAASGSNYEDALRFFERASEWNPSLDGLDLNWGRAAFLASRFSDAIGPLSRYTRSHPNDSSILGAVAMSQFMTQNYSGCIATLTGVDENIASIPQMQYIYAESLVKTGQVSSGIERLESLEKVHPEIAEVHRDLGDALALQGAKQKAAKELRTAILLNANDPEAHYELGKIDLESGNVTAAIPELESAIRLLPHDLRFHQELASAYKMALRPADAEKELHIHDALGASQTQPVITGAESHETKAP